MRRLLILVGLSLVLPGLLPEPVEARRLLQDGAIEAHVPDGDWCAERVYVELRTPVQESFAGDAYQVRRAVAILASLLPLECAQARELELVGTVGGMPVWRAAAGVSFGELRVLSSPTQGDLVPLDERQRTIEIQRTLNSLGFDAGSPDGMAGPRTRAAIQAWRASRGLEGTARASADVLLALRREHGAASAAPEAELQELAGRPPAAITRIDSSPAGPASGTGAVAMGASARPASGPPAASGKLHDLAAAQDLLLIDGRLALNGGYLVPQSIRRSDPGPLLDRLALRAAPELTGEDETALAYFNLLPLEQRRSMIEGAVATLTEQQRNNLERQEWRLLRGTLRQMGWNEFELQRLLQMFRNEGQPRLIAEAPDLPLPVVVVCGATLDHYDFEQQRFSLELGCSGSFKGSNLVQVQRPFFDVPSHLEMEPEAAESLRRRLANGNRVYAAIIASGTNVAPRTAPLHGFELRLTPERLTIYEDEDLKHPLLQLEIAPNPAMEVAAGDLSIDPQRLVVGEIRDAQNQFAEEQALLRRHLNLLALAAVPSLLEEDSYALAYMEQLSSEQQRRLAEQVGVSFDAIFGERGKLARNVNGRLDEFARHRLLGAFRTDFVPQLLEMAPTLPLRVLMYCDLELGEYDFKRSLYPFAQSLDHFCGHVPGLRGGWFKAPLALAGAPAGIAVGLEEAPAFREQHLVRKFQLGGRTQVGKPTARLGIELSITAVSEQPQSRPDKPGFDVEVKPERVLLFSAADEERRAPLRRLEFQLHDPSKVSAEPLDIPGLAEDPTVLLTLLKAGLMEPTEEVWRAWIAARVRLEASSNRDAWPKFFGGALPANWQRHDGGEQISEHLLAHFRAWSRKRASVLPGRVEMSFGARRLADYERAAGSMPLFSATTSSGVRQLAEQIGVPLDYLDVQQLRNHHRFPLPVEALVLALPDGASSYAVEFDPAGLARDALVSARIELDVSNPRLVQLGRKPALLMDATPRFAQLLDQEGQEEWARTEFGAKERKPPSTVAFPPEGYLAVLHGRMSGSNAVETLYAALDRHEDAFTRRQRAEKLIAAAEDFDPPGEGFWIIGEVRYDEYDFTGERFPAASLLLDDFARSHQASVTLQVADRTQFDVLLPPEEARQWQQSSGSHPSYALRARVEAERAEAAGRGSLVLRVLEFELLAEGDTLVVQDPERVLYHGGPEIAVKSSMAESAMAAPPLAASQSADTPSTGEPAGSSRSLLSILGVSLGDEREAAIDLLSGEVADPRVFYTDRNERSQLGGMTLWSPFNEAVMIRSGDGHEAVMVYSEPPTAAERVTALSRWIELAASRPPLTSVERLLIERYGEADYRVGRDSVLLLGWHDADEVASMGCGIALDTLSLKRWPFDRLPWLGSGEQLPPPPPTINTVTSADTFEGAFPFAVPGLVDQDVSLRCPEILVTMIVAAPDGRALRILTALGNPLDLAQTVEANRTSMMQGAANESLPEIEIKF